MVEDRVSPTSASLRYATLIQYLILAFNCNKEDAWKRSRVYQILKISTDKYKDGWHEHLVSIIILNFVSVQ